MISKAFDSMLLTTQDWKLLSRDLPVRVLSFSQSADGLVENIVQKMEYCNDYSLTVKLCNINTPQNLE